MMLAYGPGIIIVEDKELVEEEDTLVGLQTMERRRTHRRPTTGEVI